MHRATKRPPFLSSILLPSALLLIACNRGEGLESPEVATEPAAEMSREGDQPPVAAHHRGGKKVERLCEKLECSAEQRVRIQSIAERLRGERPKPRGDRSAANGALAEAFGGERFTRADVTAYREAVTPDLDGLDAKIAAATVELHGLLEAKQREALALEITRSGLPLVRGSKHGPKRRGRHHDERAGGEGHGGGDRGARVAARLCAEIACTEAQQARIAALMQPRPEPAEVAQTDRDALAEAFRSDALSEADVTAYLEALTKARAAQHERQATRVVELHGALTPEQRGKLAERVAVEGPRGFGLRVGGEHQGKKGGHGKKGGRGGKGGHAKRGGHGRKGAGGLGGGHGAQGVG